MNAKDIQLLIMPGIGEDERMSYAQDVLPYRIIRPRYIETRREETMQHYVSRLADSVSKIIDHSKPLFIMGVSYGGCIAQELSHYLHTKGIILISTYRNSSELSGFSRLLGRVICPRAPIWLYEVGEWIAPLVIGAITRMPRSDVKLLCRMYHDFPKTWFREQCYMGAMWKGCKVHVPILRIHGSKDPIIPYRGQRDITVLVEGDQHMCNLAEKEMVNQEIANFIQGILQQ